MILVRHSSTVGAFWHMMVATLRMLMLHESHLLVSAWPTAHHLMAEDAAAVVSGEGSATVKLRPAAQWMSLSAEVKMRVFICFCQKAPFVRERMLLM